MKILGLPGSEPADQRGRQPRAVQILMETSLPVDIYTEKRVSCRNSMGNWIFLSSSFAVKNVGIFLRNVGKSDKNVGISIKDVGKRRGGKRGEIPTLEIPKSLGKLHMYGI